MYADLGHVEDGQVTALEPTFWSNIKKTLVSRKESQLKPC